MQRVSGLDARRGGSAVRIYVVRHAEHVNSIVPHLSRKGSLQAAAIAKTLKRKRRLVAVYSSPRSLETAREISLELGLPVCPDKRLLPWNGGQLTGWSMQQVQQAMPDVYQKRFVERNPDYKVPDGESLNDRYFRVKSFLTDCVRRHVGEQIVVVTHGGVIDDLFRNARSLPPTQLTGLNKPYGSLSVLVHVNGRFHEELWGGVDHLPQVVAVSPSGGHLYLFPHQVAGSFPMLRGDLGELCKPATKAEMDTYEVIGRDCPEVAQCTPTYLGKVVIDVKHIMECSTNGCSNNSNNNINASNNNASNGTHVADPCFSSCEPSDSTLLVGDEPSLGMAVANCRRRSLSGASSDDYPDGKRRRLEAGDYQQPVGALFGSGAGMHQQPSQESMMAIEEDSALVDTKSPPPSKPWGVDALWSRFAKGRKNKALEVGDGKFVYLIMEDLTHGLKLPNILDLKCGTQQWNEKDSAEKKLAKTKRVENSTSKSLGARVGGLQVWDTECSAYIRRDKYWGRNLDDQGLYNALCFFVTDRKSGKVRTQVVKDILSQIDVLECAVKSSCWKFYGCSVLIVYEGCNNQVAVVDPTLQNSATMDTAGDNGCNNNPAVVTYVSPGDLAAGADCVGGNNNNDNGNNVTGMDLAGLDFPLAPASRFGDSRGQLRAMYRSRSVRSRSASFDHIVGAEHMGVHGAAALTLASPYTASQRPSLTATVRLIDFAKADRNKTGGHDTGLVFGLSSLRKLFSKILLDAPYSASAVVNNAIFLQRRDSTSSQQSIF